jgi:hypothetical protein
LNVPFAHGEQAFAQLDGVFRVLECAFQTELDPIGPFCRRANLEESLDVFLLVSFEEFAEV